MSDTSSRLLPVCRDHYHDDLGIELAVTRDCFLCEWRADKAKLARLEAALEVEALAFELYCIAFEGVERSELQGDWNSCSDGYTKQTFRKKARAIRRAGGLEPL